MRNLEIATAYYRVMEDQNVEFSGVIKLKLIVIRDRTDRPSKTPLHLSHRGWDFHKWYLIISWVETQGGNVNLGIFTENVKINVVYKWENTVEENRYANKHSGECAFSQQRFQYRAYPWSNCLVGLCDDWNRCELWMCSEVHRKEERVWAESNRSDIPRPMKMFKSKLDTWQRKWCTQPSAALWGCSLPTSWMHSAALCWPLRVNLAVFR